MSKKIKSESIIDPIRLKAARCYLNNDYNDAIIEFSKVIEKYPYDDLAYAFRGNSYLELLLDKKAFIDYAKAIEINPSNPDNYLYRADANKKLGKYDDAITDYTEAIKLGHKGIKSIYIRGLLFAYQSMYRECIEDMKYVISKDPNHVEAYSCLASAIYMTRDYKNAIRALNTSLKKDPTNVSDIERRAVSKSMTGDTKGALKDFSLALSIEPNNTSVIQSLAEHKDRCGDHLGAETERRKVFEIIKSEKLPREIPDKNSNLDSLKMQIIALNQIRESEVEELRQSIMSLQKDKSYGKIERISSKDLIQDDSPNVFQKENDVWLVQYRSGELFMVKNSVGMYYIKTVLANPHQDVFATELVNSRTKGISENEVFQNDLIPNKKIKIKNFDKKAIEYLEEQLKIEEEELGELSMLDENYDEQVTKIEMIKKELMHGKQNQINPDDRKNATAVSNAIRRAIEIIREKDTEFADHLEKSIDTGLRVSYRPNKPIEWMC
ncbi:MAG: tetratricopeptide repeat protein [Bacteroidetes bacterium]|nr:MAG: tetratricopeptide repeat protein [Bacteroidota bacterium]